MKNRHDTREGWLKAAKNSLDKEFFAGRGYTLPDRVDCSCGFPRGKSSVIGQCFDPEVSADGTTNIFICPSQDDTMRVLDILLHELIHACVGLKCKHRGAFRKMALEFGLEGKMTATMVSPGTPLHNTLGQIATELGDYPHAALSKSKKDGDEEKEPKDKGWSWCYSKNEPKFKLQLRHKMREEFGVPKDPWGEPMVVEGEEGEEDDEGAGENTGD
jgi:hypothetical protein